MEKKKPQRSILPRRAGPHTTKNSLSRVNCTSTQSSLRTSRRFAKERFHRYHGIHKDKYYLYLKEMEFRFNNRKSNVFKKMFEIIHM